MNKRMEETLKWMAGETIKRVRNTLDTSGTRAGGARFSPLSPVTFLLSQTVPFRKPKNKAERAANRAYRKTRKPLIDTGHMYRSVRIISESLHGTFKEIVIGVAPYASRHEFGSDRVPARPFFHLKNVDVQDFTARVKLVLTRG